MARWWQVVARLPWALLLVAAGVVLLVLGWYGVSGQSTTAQQLPYFVSATVPGAALVVVGAIMVGAGMLRDRRRDADRMLADLHATLLEAAAAESGAESAVLSEPAGAAAPEPRRAGDDGALIAVDGGTLVHRTSCALVAGKTTAHVVSAAEAVERGLRPCPVCAPGVTGG